jgi:uncharacterized coiled-coil protein SlyX
MATPRPESRLSELESKMAIQDARIRELADDTAEELKVIRQSMQVGFSEVKQDINQVEGGMMSSFKKIGDTIIDTLATKDDITDLKTIVATKEDVSKFEARFGKIEAAQIEQGQRMDTMDDKLGQILTLLQEKLGG